VNWSGELQRRTPFRLSQAESQFFIRMEDEFDEPKFMFRDEGPAEWKESDLFSEPVPLEMASGVKAWLNTDYAQVLLALAEAQDKELGLISERFGEINLRKDEEGEGWLWHPALGVFRALD
jgi:CRISPR-associated endonuclease/helicase Cas3